MEIHYFELSEIDYDKIKYVVLLAEYKEELVLIRNKERTLWELPGGKRDEGESLLRAASRELYEETGALISELTPYGIYSLNGSYGMILHAKILELGQLPEFEIAELKLCKSLPDELNYGELFYGMYDRWNGIKNKGNLNKYQIKYEEESNKCAL